MILMIQLMCIYICIYIYIYIYHIYIYIHIHICLLIYIYIYAHIIDYFDTGRGRVHRARAAPVALWSLLIRAPVRPVGGCGMVR